MESIIHHIKNISLAILFCITCFSCEEFVDIDPPISQIVREKVFESDKTAIAAIIGIYQGLFSISNYASGSASSVTAVAGLSADELKYYSVIANDPLSGFYHNQINVDNARNLGIWSSAYNTIYQVNSALEGLSGSTGILPATKQQLEGEARFIRAFTYFYLVNLFGEVPVVTTTDYSINSLAFRNSEEDVYAQILEDLILARELVNSAYIGTDRTRVNEYAVTAMLARVYLYRGESILAEAMADKVINQTTTYELLDDLNSVFLIDSREVLWHLSSGDMGYTYEGNTFILNAAPSLYAMSDELLSAFEVGDKRFADWVGVYETYYYPHKYKVTQETMTTAKREYSVVLRLPEQYLIRAEAKIRQNRVGEGIADLNELREKRRGSNPGDLPALPTTLSREDALLKVAHERRVELFAEWGHRWLDLKRTGRAGAVLSPLKPLWQSTDVLYPIPQLEREKDPNLTQNLGY